MKLVILIHGSAVNFLRHESESWQHMVEAGIPACGGDLAGHGCGSNIAACTTRDGTDGQRAAASGARACVGAECFLPMEKEHH